MIGSLCSGYGGLDLAVQAVFGQSVAWHCENEDAPSRVLEAHWPGVPNLGDLTEVDWDSVESVEVIAAGYPCTPFSHAGQRKGADDERHLWPFVAEAICRIRPRLVVLENVAGHRSLGFGRVLGDLAALRYDTRWASLRAADVGAPHGRERVFIVAVDPDAAERGRRAAGWDDGLRAARLVEGVAADSAHVGHERGGRARHGRPGSANGRGNPAADPPPSGRPDKPISGDPARQYERAVAGPGSRDSARATAARVHDVGGASAVLAVAADPDSGGLESVGRVDTLRRDPHRRDHPDGARDAGQPAAAAAYPGGKRLGQHTGEPPTQETRPVDRDEPASGDRLRAATDWGPYRGAIERWERILGRAAPAPTELGPRTGQRLSPRFVEFMMGLPDGWVTDVDGISRNEQLRMLGNGVVPQQAEAALRALIAAAAA